MEDTIKKNLNININQDDSNISDYLYCWSQFGVRPNRMNLYYRYNLDKFNEVISKYSLDFHGVVSDIIPCLEKPIINRRNLVKLTDNLFISFLQLDLENSEIVSDVSLYYTEDDNLKDIVTNLLLIEAKEESQFKNQINTIQIGQVGLELQNINLFDDIDSNKIEKFYNKSTLESTNLLIDSINKTKKGISVIWGNRGVGKTYLSNYIVDEVDKTIIFVPLPSVDVINSTEFSSLLKDYQDSVIIIDDIECVFDEPYKRPGFFIGNLIQLVDGYQSDMMRCHIILIMNVDSQDFIPEEILGCNNLLHIIHVDLLDLDVSKKLAKKLKSNLTPKVNTRLIDIIRGNNIKKIDKKVGY